MGNNWKIKYNVEDISFKEDVQILDDFIPKDICEGIADYAFNTATYNYLNQSEGDNRSQHWGSAVVGYPNYKFNSFEEYLDKSKKEWESITKKCPSLKELWNFLKENSPVKKFLPQYPTRALFNCSTGGHGDISHLDTSSDFYVVTHIIYLIPL